MRLDYSIRQIRRFWEWEALGLIALFGVSMVLCVVRDSEWYIAIGFAGCILLMLRMSYFVRCPKCRRWLRARIVRRRLTDWFLYDCHHCRVTWDPGFSQSD